MDTLRENPSSSRKLADHNSTMSPRILAQPSSSDALDASPQQLEEFAPRGSGPLLDEHQVFGVKEASTRLWREGQVCLHGHRIQQELKDASYQPPIEREKFDLLNIDKLADDRRFRHALNHTAYLVFHSRTTKGQLEDNSRYCSVVVLELVLLLSNNSSQSRCSCTTGQSSLQDLQPYLNRLPDFLDAIRQLVKDLVRHEYYELVDEVLDVNLLMNQLRNRCCDLLSLMEWLGCILKESCSPIRDAQIDGTICLVMRAVDTRDGEALAFGLASLFEVFETMRLVRVATLWHSTSSQLS